MPKIRTERSRVRVGDYRTSQLANGEQGTNRYTTKGYMALRNRFPTAIKSEAVNGRKGEWRTPVERAQYSFSAIILLDAA